MTKRAINAGLVMVAAAACLWAGAASPGAVASSSRVTAAVERYTPLVMSVFAPPRWFKGVDGRFHLVYELTLLNGFPAPVTVRSVSVIDAKRRITLTRLSGARLASSM